MAETEAAPVVEAPPADEASTSPATAADQANGEDPEARYRYDDALLIRGPKGQIRRPQKPDEQERNLTVDKLKAEIEKHSARIKEIKETVDLARSARSAGSAGNQDIIRKLQTLRNEFQSVLRQKQHIREELQAVQKARDDARTKLREARDKLPKGRDITADNIEAKIAELEFKQSHESNTPQEEEALRNRIKDLIASKPVFKQAAAAEAAMRAADTQRADIQARLQKCDAVLSDVKAREDTERAALDASRAKQAENEPDIPALNVEKKECWDIIVALRAKIDEIRKAFSEKYTEYIKLDRNYNAYQRFKKHQEYLERQKAREERAAAENGTSEGGAGPDTVVVEAYASEVLTLDQLVTYLRKLLPSDDKGAGSAVVAKQVEVPQGMKLLKKKDDDEFMAVARKPKGKGKGAASAAPAPAADTPKAAPEPAKKKLNHGIDTLQTFMRFGIEVPQTTAELPATIDKVVAKKDYYLELRRTGQKEKPPARPVAPVEEEAPQAEEAAEGGEASSSAQGSGDAPTPAEAAGGVTSAAQEAAPPAPVEAAKGPTPAPGSVAVVVDVDEAAPAVSVSIVVGA